MTLADDWTIKPQHKQTNFPPIPVGQTVLPTAIPLKAPLKHYLYFYDMHIVIPLQSHWVSTQMGGITVDYTGADPGFLNWGFKFAERVRFDHFTHIFSEIPMKMK